MPYTDVWNNTLPTGAEAANTIDDIFRSLKLDISERLDDIFGGMPSFTTDPLRPYGLKFTDAQDAIINFGNNAGAPRNIAFKDKTGASTYITIGDGITLGPTLGTGAAGKITFHTTDGLQLSGRAGSIYNFVVATPAGAYVMRNPIGTQNIAMLGSLDVTTNITAGVNVIGQNVAGNASIGINGKSNLQSPVDGNFTLFNSLQTSFNLLQFGGTTASFPALKRNGATLETKLADDSAYAVHRLGSVILDAVNFSNFAGQAKIIGGTTGINFRNNADNTNTFTIDNSGNIASGGVITSSSDVFAGATNSLRWTGRSVMQSPSSGTILLLNTTGTDFNFLQFGGVSASFPALKKNAATIEVKLADDSAFANIKAATFVSGATNALSTTQTLLQIIGGATSSSFRNSANNADNLLITDAGAVTVRAGLTVSSVGITVISGGIVISASGLSVTGGATVDSLTSTTSIVAGASSNIGWNGRSLISSPADGNILLRNNAGTDFTLLQLGGTTSSFPALKRSTTSIQVRLADDSAFGSLVADILKVDLAAGSDGLQLKKIADTAGINSVSPTVIVNLSGISAGQVLVTGNDGGTHSFVDIVWLAPTGTSGPVSQGLNATAGTATRVYSYSGGNLALQTTAGTYSVKVGGILSTTF